MVLRSLLAMQSTNSQGGLNRENDEGRAKAPRMRSVTVALRRCMLRKPSLVAALVVAAITVSGTAAAQAAPPVILSASQTDGHPNLSWSLPVGGTVETIEIAKSAAVGTDGS